MKMVTRFVAFLFLFSAAYSLKSFTLSDCGKTKACYKSSKYCTIDSCDFIVTWYPMKYQNKRYISIELIGNIREVGGYIALQFSKDKEMGDDGFVACHSIAGTSDVGFLAGYHDKETNNRVIIEQNKLDKDFIVFKDKNAELGGSFPTGTNRISCRFLRLAKPKFNADKLMNLEDGLNYYLIVSRGVTFSKYGLGKTLPGTVVVSKDKLSLSSGSFNTVSGSSSSNSPMAKAHGVLMIISWLCLCGIAVILARYYKDIWPAKMRSEYSENGWFNPHRGMQASALILMVISLIIIFVAVGGYSKLEDSPYFLHPILGLISVILFFINPFIALCRCRRYAKQRPVFNWIHFIVGAVAYILSVPTIFLGLKLPGAGLNLSRLNYPQWIVILFVIFQFIVELTLEIYGCCTYRKNKLKYHRYEKEVEEYERAIQTGKESLLPPDHPKQTGRTFRLALLVIYIAVAVLVTVVLSVVIILN